jgi:hypothetical protein
MQTLRQPLLLADGRVTFAKHCERVRLTVAAAGGATVILVSIGIHAMGFAPGEARPITHPPGQSVNSAHPARHAAKPIKLGGEMAASPDPRSSCPVTGPILPNT